MLADLHIHTTVSDGDIDPDTVVYFAARAGLKIIALTDHETTSGFKPANIAGKRFGVTVIPGVELLTEHRNREIHLLGYFTDPDSKHLQRELTELRNLRNVCAREAINRLKEFGFRINWSEVEKLAHDGGPVSKGHIVQAMSNAGYIKSRSDAIDFLKKYLNHQGLANISHPYPFEDAVSMIRNSGGIPVLAHPGLIGDEGVVDELCCKGIEGIEVFYYYFGRSREELVQRYALKADQRKLLKTGGSDYHGTITPVVLGENPVPIDGISDFLCLFGISDKKTSS